MCVSVSVCVSEYRQHIKKGKPCQHYPLVLHKHPILKPRTVPIPHYYSWNRVC